MSTSLAQRLFDEAEKFEGNGLYQEAIESYIKATEVDPSFAKAYHNLAILYHQTNQFDSAITNLKKALELEPNDASAYNNLGVLFCKTQKFNEAKESFEKALSLEGDYQEARDNLGKVLQKLEKVGFTTQVKRTIRMHRQNIGFVTLWYERGQAYVTKALRDALDNEYNTFVFARNGGTTDNPLIQTSGEWNVPNLTVYPEYKIPRDVLKDWIVRNYLTVVFFNEEYDLGLVEIARQCGAKTIGYYVWELFNPQYVPGCKHLYDKIICPTKSCYEKFKKLGMDNIEYVQWGIDLNVFKPIERPDNKRLRFFHPAGWGGLHARRGTQFVIDAFLKLNDPNTELLIHTQHGSGVQEDKNIKIRSGTVSRDELIRMYQESDVTVLPSKWEGLGLTFLESIGCGLPIITVDAPPMNEFVHDGETGCLCRVAERQNYEGIFVEGVHADIDDMAEKMRSLANDRSLLQKMREKTVSMCATSWRQEIFRSAIQKIVKGIAPDSVKVLAGNQTISSDSGACLQRFIHCPVNVNRMQNIVDSRPKHIMDFVGISPEQFEQLTKDTGKIVGKEWDLHIQSGRPIKDFYSSVSNNIILSYANMEGPIGTYWRLEYIVRVLSPFVSRNGAFLDFGAGIGETGIYFSDICNVTLFDIHGAAQEFAKFHAARMGANICFLNNIHDVKEGFFDLISAQDVLEHIEDPMDTVEKLYRALKPGGYFITSGFWFNPDAQGHLASNIRYRETWLSDFIKMGFNYVCWFGGDNWVIAVFQKPPVAAVDGKKHFTKAVTNSNEGFRLISKDYARCSLVRKEDGRQFIRKDNYEEPFVVHLVGARWSNHPWGMENEIHRALEKFGVTIIDTDFRRDFDRLSDLFLQKAHLVLVVKGNGIPPELVSKQPCKTVLWYQDDVFSTEHAPKHLVYNGWAFDTVYSFDEMALDRYRELGVKNPKYLPLAMSPEVHRKMFLVKKAHDICFVGNVYPNRKALLERLARRFNLFVTRAFMDDMVKIFNESKIILNLGVGQTGVQQRVFEAMGCGSLLLTNGIQEKSQLFRDRVHLVYFQDTNVEELAEYYLSHDEEREAIALAGYREVNARHTFQHRIQKILDDVFCREILSVQPTTEVKRADHRCNLSTSSTPTLSVVVATYNRKALLQGCIDNLLKNSDQNIEVIVVDDPCADGTREWLDEIKTKSRNIVVIHNQKHEGAQRSMNIGFGTATGQYIGLINDDVEVTKGWDSALVSLLESDPSYGTAIPLVVANGNIHSLGMIEGIRSIKYPQMKPIHGMKGSFFKGKNPDQVPESKCVREVEYGYYWVMKREVWEKIGGIDDGLGKYCGDADFGLRVRIAGYKNMYCPTSVIIEHGLNLAPSGETNAELLKSQKVFVAKWGAYFDTTNPILCGNKKYKVLVVLACDKKDLKQGIRTAVDDLSKQQHTVNFVVCNDLAARMDVDVMNHIFVEGVSTFQPDILLILGGKDIYPRMLRKLKRALNLTIMLWWHPDMGNKVGEMPAWAVQLNKETDVCFISGASLDYVKHAETQGIRRGYWLACEEQIACDVFSVIYGTDKDRITLYKDIVEHLEDGVSREGLLHFAKLLTKNGMGRLCIPLFNKIIQVDPKSLDVYLMLSDQYYKQEMFEQSIEVLQHALEVPLQSPEIDCRLGNAYLKRGDIQEAEKWLKSALLHHSSDPDVYHSLGRIALQRDAWDEAEGYFKSGIKECRNDVTGLVELAKLYGKQQRIDESIACFQQGLRNDPDYEYEDEIRSNLETLYSLKEVKYDVSKIQISVLMLSFNRAEYLARSLYLFSKQSFPRQAFEIIIIDSSSDNTKDVIRDAVRQYGLTIRYYFVPSEGPDANLNWYNMGVKQSRGEVVVWTHPEILFSPGMLEDFLKPHLLEDKLWVCGKMGVILTKEEQHKIDQVWNKDIDYLMANFNVRKEVSRLGYKFWLPLLVSFKRDAFLKMGGFAENLPAPRHSDLDLFFRMLAIGFSIHNPPGFQGIHQWHTPMEERGQDLLPLMEKTRELVYEWRRAFLRNEVSAEKYALRNEGKEIGIVSDIREETIK